MLRALRDNESCACCATATSSGGGIEVEFFGERTTLPAGPATLALRTGAPILPGRRVLHAAGQRPPRRRPPAGPDRARAGTLREDVTRITQDLAHELEYLIRRAPEQWHLFQPNWPSDPGYQR